jgi:Nucleotidyltransferase of unknown function (DUF6036)
MSDELEVLKLVTTRLEGAGIAYMVSGSMAMNYYAQPRMTRDIDLVVDLLPADADRIVRLFSADFYCDPDTVRDAIARRFMFNLIHSTLAVKVDFIVRKATPYRKAEFLRRREAVVAGFHLWLVSPEDLILSKLVWAKDSHSELQLNDVKNLIASAASLDWPYVERWASELTVVTLLAEVRT